MEEVFYINYDEKRDWYMLCIRETHFVISAGNDLDKILGVLSDYAKTYRYSGRLMSKLSSLESKGLVTPKVFAQREEYYKEHGHDYDDLIKRTVERSIKEAREWDKENSLFAKTKKRLKKSGVKRPIETHIKEKDTTPIPTQDTPKVLNFRPKVLPRKKITFLV